MFLKPDIVTPAQRAQQQIINLRKHTIEIPERIRNSRKRMPKNTKRSFLESKFFELLRVKSVDYSELYCVNDITYDIAIYVYNQLACLIDIRPKEDTESRRNSISNKSSNIKYVYMTDETFEDSLQEIFEIFDFDYNQYINDVFEWCRQTGLPFPKYPANVLWSAYNSIIYFDIKEYKPLQRIGDKVIRHFHGDTLFKSFLQKSPSPYVAWEDDNLLMQCIKNRFIYIDFINPGRVLSGFKINKIAPSPSYFTASLAKYITGTYLNEFQTVFDPFTGFSGRMLGVTATGKQYIGQDLNQNLINESKDIVDYFGIVGVQLKQQDITTDEPQSYECLMTCPPYNLKEQWGNENQLDLSCDQWIDICLEKYDCKRYVFVVDVTEKYKDNIVEYLSFKSHFSNNAEKIIVIDK